MECVFSILSVLIKLFKGYNYDFYEQLNGDDEEDDDIEEELENMFLLDLDLDFEGKGQYLINWNVNLLL